MGVTNGCVTKISVSHNLKSTHTLRKGSGMARAGRCNARVYLKGTPARVLIAAVSGSGEVQGYWGVLMEQCGVLFCEEADESE